MSVRHKHRLLNLLVVVALVVAVPATLRRDSLWAQLRSALDEVVPRTLPTLNPLGNISAPVEMGADYFGTALDAWNGTVAVGAGTLAVDPAAAGSGLRIVSVFNQNLTLGSYYLEDYFSNLEASDLVLGPVPGGVGLAVANGTHVLLYRRPSSTGIWDHLLNLVSPLANCTEPAWAVDYRHPFLAVGARGCGATPLARASVYTCDSGLTNCTSVADDLGCEGYPADSECGRDVALACPGGSSVCDLLLKRSHGLTRFTCSLGGNCTYVEDRPSPFAGPTVSCDPQKTGRSCMLTFVNGTDPFLVPNNASSIVDLPDVYGGLLVTDGRQSEPWAGLTDALAQTGELYHRPTLAGLYNLTHLIGQGGPITPLEGFGARIRFDYLTQRFFVSRPGGKFGRVFYYDLPAEPPTPTPTSTPTASATPTSTSTPVPPTATSTPTATATASPTATPTATPTASPSPTVSPTPSGPIDDIDGDGELEALTDGLLKLRWLFGFRGDVLVLNAYDPVNCTRCNAMAISLYLQAIEHLLDIDGDGEVEPLTDGVLNLRWLFGFGGDALILNAYDPVNCTRCNEEQIVPYLQNLTSP